jgi:hypothetical protein
MIKVPLAVSLSLFLPILPKPVLHRRREVGSAPSVWFLIPVKNAGTQRKENSFVSIESIEEMRST